ncbi:hypothetical protein TCAL_00369 [Tigriopus californicus]|uniref:glutamine--tRNA ligase n=1 Tax=Tigriopus californicus TaxID=6832 RepID=A0A553NBV6_TIGCA|nr:probable glutamine--tRNA ligase [Tigriopus californicus]TRY62895.1 hypothetical protein TCAL_00369 [Tigriopus californicus]|eukprot:TCALIF_00369-PA protein Name:"Similar to Aats-gln Probable glutamine--tRNA ligase (Drosophila melanogaster)" AED:0.01 eAED:0.01 QI:17/1/1/1/1/1/2/113/790
MESLFQEIGLSETKAKETIKNGKLAAALKSVIEAAKKAGDAGSKPEKLTACGPLLYNAAAKMKPQVFHHAPFLVQYIMEGKIDSEVRLAAALDFLLKNPGQNIDPVAFEGHCGVGVQVTPEQIEQAVEKVLAQNRAELLEKRYRFQSGIFMGEIRKVLPWADGKAVKNEIDLQILDLLGPKTEADMAPLPKASKKKPEPEAKAAQAKNQGSEAKGQIKTQAPARNNAVESEEFESIAELMKTKVHFHKPGQNFTTDGYVVTPKTQELLAAHLKRTNGRVQTRFPPEPNGLLHIGHAKAININFGYASAHGGVCYLRYDDTNPEKEEEKFFLGIKDIVEWLGYQPFKITHSSDYFQQLYQWAKVLIDKDLAYVCHQRVEDIRGFNPPPSPWRTRPRQESVQLFEDMKNGKFDEGEATLRLKLTLEEGKQDPVAYRIKYAHHHRTGDQWCIYPTYDYTHCLCDSLEDITHSLCTKEFQNRRSSYYWLCNAVDTYCPVQWEYGRLNVNYTVVSKRKIGKLITSGICSDWDDPRLFTLAALRRRGFPAEAINAFCAKIGVTGATMTIDPSMLEAVIRNHLNISAPRTMVVLEPLKVNITNFVPGMSYEIEVPDFPDNPEKGSHKITFGQCLYIERSDFKDSEEKGYRRLSPKQSVGLRYAGYVLKVVKVHKDSGNEVSEVDVEATPVDKITEKPKAFIHWVSNPLEIEVRLYDTLFLHKNPEDPNEVPDGFLSDINPNSLNTLKSYADGYLSQAKTYDRFQFERTGFFTVDKDSRSDLIVFNRTVSLKEDAKKS